MCTLGKETIDAILELGQIYEVGGAVRDRLMGGSVDSKDVDYLVTGVAYDDLTRLLRRFGKVDLVGKSFGVLKFTRFDDDRPLTFDLTLPRTEYSTGVGHKEFAVTADPSLSVDDDLRRRDFTINAMARSLRDGSLIDPLGGRKDLDERLLRIVYPESFRDDPLRMLRAVQFAARFNLTVEPETLRAMTADAHLITTVSAERIADELNKLLEKAAKPSVGFRLMRETGLLERILPELHECVGVEQPGGYHAYDVFEHTLHVLDAAPKRLPVRLAALFHDINKPQHRRLIEKGATFYGHEISGATTAKKVMTRLRYSRDLIADVIRLVERHMFTTDVTDKGLRRLMRRVGVPLIFDLLDLRRADVAGQGMGGTTDDVDRFEAAIRAELERKAPLGFGDLAINGNDIMQLFDMAPGPEVGRILDHLMEAVLDDPEQNQREILESLARQFHLTNNSLDGMDRKQEQ